MLVCKLVLFLSPPSEAAADVKRETHRDSAAPATDRASRSRREIQGGRFMAAALGGDKRPDPSALRRKYLEERDKREEVDVAVIGGGFGGLLTAAKLRGQQGVRFPADHRAGRRFRRHLVLEPLSRRSLRHRILLLHAAAGRSRDGAQRTLRRRRRDLCPLPGDRPAFRPLRGKAMFQTRATRSPYGTRQAARWIVSTSRQADSHQAPGS
jgi:hypothetical protein